MYLFAILSSFICIQLILSVSSDTSDVSRNSPSNDLVQTPTILNTEDILDNESDEEYAYVPRSAQFLRFGRQMSPSSGSFLRFGRSNQPFLRFGRAGQNGGTFLRFGRQAQQSPSSNFLRFGRKGEFLRFG